MADVIDDHGIVIAMAKAGLATQSELARLAGVSRQLVRYWCEREAIDVGKTRAAYLQLQWNKRL